MNNYFSIGEISKMSNLSVQTLRHYDKLGLLKPILVKENGYRYYSLEQFYKLDFIGFYKNLGMSLLEIKDLLDNNVNINDVPNLLKTQEEEIDKEIKALQNRKKLIREKNEYITFMLSKPIGKAFINEKPKKNMIRVNTENKPLEEAEFSLREVLNKFPKLNNPLTLELIYGIDCNKFMECNELKFNSYFIGIGDDIEEYSNVKISQIDEGLYASVFYIDYCENIEVYINELIEFVKNNNMSVEGPLYTFYIASEFYSDKEKVFMELFVKVNPKNY